MVNGQYASATKTNMPTQQQINIAAYKAGVKPEEIQRQLQAKGITSTTPVSKPPIVPTTPTPVVGNTMDTSTGAPYVAPTSTLPTPASPLVPTPTNVPS